MSDIPSELLHDILIRLPEELLFRLRAVCKAWRCIIDDPCFINSHINTHSHSRTTLLLTNSGANTSLYSLSWDSLNYADGRQTIYVTPDKALGHAGFHPLMNPPEATCNGLILISHPLRSKNMVICNPLTQEFHVVPHPPPKGNRLDTSMAWGLGYDSVADDYKIVMVSCAGTYEYLVYSLKLDSWSTVKNSRDFRPWGTGVYLNGALYWTLAPGAAVSNGRRIVILDIATKEIRLLPQPLTCFVPADVRFHLHVLDGFLACSYKSTVDSVVIWVMRENGAWTKLFSWREFVFIRGGNNLMADLAPHCSDYCWKHLWPVAYSERKGQLLFFQGQCNKFLWCDLVNHSAKIVTLRGNVKLTYYSQICVGSLFQLGRLNRTLPVKLTGQKRKTRSPGRRRLEIHVGESAD